MRFLKRKKNQVPDYPIPLTQDALSFLHSAQAFRLKLIELIQQAQQRIVICSLYLQDDQAGQEILQALYQAKQQRPVLDIVILVDWHRAQRGLIGAAKSLGNAALYQQQGELHGYSIPIYGIPVQTRELFGVLHLKGFVFDDTVVYSGASLNNVYLHKHDKYRHDRYLLIQNKQLADSMQQFARQHLFSAAAVHRLDKHGAPATKHIRREIRAFRESLKKARYEWHQDEQASQQLSVLPIVGVGKNNPLNRQLLLLLAQARQQITICTPYFNFPLAVKREIASALQRGVKVDIIIGDKTANDFYIPPEQEFKFIGALPYLYEMNLRRFSKTYQRYLQSGLLHLHLWRDQEHSYHLKGIWIDQEYTIITGNNLNPRAFRLDLENALIIHDPQGQILAQRQQELASIYQHTTALQHYQQLQSLDDYPAPVQKLLRRLSRARLDRLAYRVL